MATPSKVHLTVEDTGIFKFKSQTTETAAKTSELLQENHDVTHSSLDQKYTTDTRHRNITSFSM
jgi:hypothetical protein